MEPAWPAQSTVGVAYSSEDGIQVLALVREVLRPLSYLSGSHMSFISFGHSLTLLFRLTLKSPRAYSDLDLMGTLHPQLPNTGIRDLGTAPQLVDQLEILILALLNCLFWRQGIASHTRLALSSQSSCSGILCAPGAAVYHHAWLQCQLCSRALNKASLKSVCPHLQPLISPCLNNSQLCST